MCRIWWLWPSSLICRLELLEVTTICRGAPASRLEAGRPSCVLVDSYLTLILCSRTCLFYCFLWPWPVSMMTTGICFVSPSLGIDTGFYRRSWAGALGSYFDRAALFSSVACLARLTWYLARPATRRRFRLVTVVTGDADACSLEAWFFTERAGCENLRACPTSCPSPK